MCFTIRLLGIIQPDLKSAIEIAENRSDLIIFTGGLGPTKDDLTKETVAAHLEKNLVIDEQALEFILKNISEE